MFQDFAAQWELSGKAVGQLYVLHRLAPQAAICAVEQFRPPANPRNIDACFMAFTRTIAYSWHDEPERDTLIAQIKQIQSTGGEGKVRWQAYCSSRRVRTDPKWHGTAGLAEFLAAERAGGSAVSLPGSAHDAHTPPTSTVTTTAQHSSSPLVTGDNSGLPAYAHPLHLSATPPTNLTNSSPQAP